MPLEKGSCQGKEAVNALSHGLAFPIFPTPSPTLTFYKRTLSSPPGTCLPSFPVSLHSISTHYFTSHLVYTSTLNSTQGLLPFWHLSWYPGPFPASFPKALCSSVFNLRYLESGEQIQKSLWASKCVLKAWWEVGLAAGWKRHLNDSSASGVWSSGS